MPRSEWESVRESETVMSTVTANEGMLMGVPALVATNDAKEEGGGRLHLQQRHQLLDIPRGKSMDGPEEAMEMRNVWDRSLSTGLGLRVS